MLYLVCVLHAHRSDPVAACMHSEKYIAVPSSWYLPGI